MKVYHGTTMIVDAPLVSIGRRNLDFGLGFYVTDIKEQAISWATRPVNGDKPNILNVYEFDIEGALASNYRYNKFEAYDSEWLDFVVENRRGGNLWKTYVLLRR